MKISIITVVLNGAKTITSTLQSISSQKYQNKEHIIIDGGSTDNTLSILTEYRGHDFKVITGSDQGIYDAMNKGIDCSRGDIIGFLNSDDTYSNDFVLSSIATAFEDETIDVSYGDLLYVDLNISKALRYWQSCDFQKGKFFDGWAPPHPTFYIRKSAIPRVGNFDMNYGHASDFEFMLRCLEIYNLKSIYIPRVLIKMRIGGVTSSGYYGIINQNLKILKACKNYSSDFSIINFLIKKIISKFKEFKLAEKYKF